MMKMLSQEELAIVKKAVRIWEVAVRNSGLYETTQNHYTEHPRRMVRWFEGKYDLLPNRDATEE